MTGKSAQYASLTHILNPESSSPVLHFPLFIELIHFFKVEMRHTPTKTPIKLKPDLPENLPEIQKQIIENILIDPKITYNELADITGKTRETIRVHIKKLKELNLIKRIGPDKGATGKFFSLFSIFRALWE